ARKRARIEPESAMRVYERLKPYDALSVDDRWMITFFTLAKFAEHRVLPRGEALQGRHLGRCLTIAADAVVRAIGTPALFWMQRMRLFIRRWECWNDEMLE